MSDRLTSRVSMNLDWSLIDVSEDSRSFVQMDRAVPPTITTLTEGSGVDEANEGYYREHTLVAGQTVEVDLKALSCTILNYTFTKSLTQCKVFGVENAGTVPIYIRTSGVSNPVSFLGYQSVVGPSGIWTIHGPLGFTIGATSKKFSLYNPSSESCTVKVLLVGVG